MNESTWRISRLPLSGPSSALLNNAVAKLNANTFGGGAIVATNQPDVVLEDSDKLDELDKLLDQQIGLPPALRATILEEGVPEPSSALGATVAWLSTRTEEDVKRRLSNAIEKKANMVVEHRTAQRQSDVFRALPKEQRKAKARNARRTWHCLVAKQRGADDVAGAVLVFTTFPTAPLPPPLPLVGEAKRSAYIANLAVHASARRTGCASALMEKAEQVARRWKYPGIFLHVHKNNKQALALYRSRGYSIVEPPTIDVGDDDDDATPGEIILRRIRKWSATPYERQGEWLMFKSL